MADVALFCSTFAERQHTVASRCDRGGWSSGKEEYRSRIFKPRKMADTMRKLVEGIDYWSHLVGEHPNNEKAASGRTATSRSSSRFSRSCSSPFEFLSRITLDPRDDVDDESDPGKVNVMTIHAASGKGTRTPGRS